jgi:hypothetical protein
MPAAALISLLVQYGPEAYAMAVQLIHAKDPTQADFMALHALVTAAEKNAADAVTAAS